MIYPNRPSNPALQAMIEAFFAEECISVVWEDVPFIEAPPTRADCSTNSHS
jgi:hypothetical protein